MKNYKVSHATSIIRGRQKLQELYPEYRGDRYNKRHYKEEPETRNEIKTWEKDDPQLSLIDEEEKMAIDTLKIFKTCEVKTPERSGINAGFDFFVPNDYPESILKPGHQVVIPSGIKVRIPRGHALIAFNKSGIAMHKHLQIGACVIDENYTGIITLHLHNIGTKIQRISPGMKLVQFILLKVNYADIKVFRNENEMYKNFNTKGRGDKGFGSTGI